MKKISLMAAGLCVVMLSAACGQKNAAVPETQNSAAQAEVCEAQSQAGETCQQPEPEECVQAAAAETSAASDAPETEAPAEEVREPETEAPADPDTDGRTAEFVGGASAIRLTSTPGTVTYGNAKATIDASNANSGYICIKYTGSNPKIKIQITKGTTYTYDVTARGQYEVFPLTEGNGTYSVKVYENEGGTSYSTAFGQDINVNLSDQFGPFLYPNQYVNFTGSTSCVQTAASLCAAGSTLDKVRAVYEYVITTMSYDTDKARTVQSGYLPNLDQVIAARKGICFDYAAVMSAMLRSQGIPSKLVVGYTGSAYHAWINVYTTEQGWINNAIYFDGNQWKLMDPTFASSGGQSEAIMKYIGNGANYQAKYTY